MIYVIFDAANGLTQQDAEDFVQAIDSAFGYPKDGIQHHTQNQAHPIEQVWRVDVSVADTTSRMFPLDVVTPDSRVTIENVAPNCAFWNPMLPP